MKKYRTLLEAITAQPGVVPIENFDGWDLYRIESWAGANAFITHNQARTPAGEQWTGNETEFNNNLVNNTNNRLYFVTETDSQLVDFGLLFTRGRTSVAIEDASGSSQNVNDLGDFYRTAVEHFIRTIQNDNGVALDAPPQQEPVENPEKDVEETPTKAVSQQDEHARDTGYARPINSDTPCILYKVVRNHVKILHVGHAVLNNSFHSVVDMLYIPRHINGLPVTEIAPYAFYGTNYARVCLPDTLKSVLPYTFYPYNRAHVIHIGENTTVYSRSVWGEDIAQYYKSHEALPELFRRDAQLLYDRLDHYQAN